MTMDVPPQPQEEKSTFTVLVTGANSGLGFALCCRLIDEFLFTRPQSQTLHLLYSTRDAKKSDSTLRRLNAHLQKTLREANGKTFGISLLLEKRIKLEGVLVDLLKLQTVKSLAEELLSRRGLVLGAVVWNAGVAGWKGLNWPQAIWSVLTDLVHATTYPPYMVCDVGLATKRQVQQSLADDGVNGKPESKLGQVFTANVFGHYLLTHWLAPLMHADTRIVWISSVSAVGETFNPEDIQGLRSLVAYESSKRLTDLLVLSSELPSTRAYVGSFLPTTATATATAGDNGDASRPKMYLTQPGVIGTSISGLPWFLSLFMHLAFYLARWLGSPWHPVQPYKGAVSAAFAVLSTQLPEQDAREGKGKWGSATGVRGDERVARTEVDGWGYCGRLGVVPQGSVTTGRFRGRWSTREGREEFESVARGMWREMEEMRGEWEGRLGGIGKWRAGAGDV